MATILNFRVNFLLVNWKIHEKLSNKMFQTQKGVNFTFPKTYPYMSLSNDTNNLAVSAVCKNFHPTPRFKAPANTVYWCHATKKSSHFSFIRSATGQIRNLTVDVMNRNYSTLLWEGFHIRSGPICSLSTFRKLHQVLN